MVQMVIAMILIALSIFRTVEASNSCFFFDRLMHLHADSKQITDQCRQSHGDRPPKRNSQNGFCYA